ncbi:MAG: hypothetical protein IT204_21155 [Fimbriimonadaceae bacterium]|nr:hypothetical protein [Fimbriimonadaceae bacterium]
MATKTTRKSGENHLVKFGTTTLGTARFTRLRLTIRSVDARGSGDGGPVDKELGLDSGELQATYLITDEATLALLGTYNTVLLQDSAGDTVFSGGALLREVQRRESHEDMTIVDALFQLQGLPTVPDLSGLGA